MELKEGMYVRFDWKKQQLPIQLPILIGKITEVHYNEDEKYYFYLTDNSLVIGEDNLVKEPSNNIIDLIEVGDYVNGCYVDEIISDNDSWDDRKHFHLLKFISYFSEEDIKSIVTKEQFESMSYEVGR